MSYHLALEPPLREVILKRLCQERDTPPRSSPRVVTPNGKPFHHLNLQYGSDDIFYEYKCPNLGTPGVHGSFWDDLTWSLIMW